MSLTNDFFEEAAGRTNPGTAQFMFATVGSRTNAGSTLIFDGETEPTEKRFKKLYGESVYAGDRVLVMKLSGTYVILGRLGK